MSAKSSLMRRIHLRSEHTLDVGKETLVLGEVRNETLDGTADHGVLAHQDDTLAAHRVSNLVHLLRRDIVDGDDEDRSELLEECLQLVEVNGLGCGLAPHVCDLLTRIGMFQASSLEVDVRCVVSGCEVLKEYCYFSLSCARGTWRGVLRTFANFGP